MSDARIIAFRVLMAVGDDARSPEALSRELGATAGDPRDRALATELVYGVLRWQRALDGLIAPFVSRGLNGLEPVALTWLRIGAYQLAMLSRIPREVAVSATQDAARRSGLGRMTGLLNAVLRKVAAGPLTLDALASMPPWVAAELRARYGERAAEEARALRERAVTTVRPTIGKGGLEATRARLATEGLHVADAPHGYLAVSGGDPFATAAWTDGAFVAQDPAGAVVIAAIPAGARVLDLCAGRGVKTTALADRGARVVAVDVSAGKLDELRALAARLGVSDRIVMTIARDATTALDDLGLFDEVLVDAPCTGLGTLRRHPEIAWRRGPDDLRSLVALQARLAQNAARRVAAGGYLTYAVCSFARAEAAAALSLPGFELVAQVDVDASSGLDAFQVRRLRRSA